MSLHLEEVLISNQKHCIAGDQESAVLLQLLAASARPYLHQLEAWLSSGLLKDPSQEFLVAEGKSRTGP